MTTWKHARWVLALTLGAWGNMISVAQACSCAEPKGSEEEQVLAEYADAKQVFVGKVIKLDRSFNDRYTVEDVEIKVTQSLKGAYKIGQVVHLQSMIGSGMCGRTVRERTPDGVMPKVEELGEWLIYGYGEEPHTISLCSRSKPADKSRDLQILQVKPARK